MANIFFKESFSELKDYKIVAKQRVKFQRDYYYYYFSFWVDLKNDKGFNIFQIPTLFYRSEWEFKP